MDNENKCYEAILTRTGEKVRIHQNKDYKDGEVVTLGQEGVREEFKIIRQIV